MTPIPDGASVPESTDAGRQHDPSAGERFFESTSTPGDVPSGPFGTFETTTSVPEEDFLETDTPREIFEKGYTAGWDAAVASMEEDEPTVPTEDSGQLASYTVVWKADEDSEDVHSKTVEATSEGEAAAKCGLTVDHSLLISVTRNTSSQE